MPPSRARRFALSCAGNRGRGLFGSHCPMSESTPDKRPFAPSRRRLSSEGRGALEMLINSESSSATEAILMAHGFSVALLAGLARYGLVAVTIGTVRAGERMLKVRRLSITEAGRRAMAKTPRRP
jgi:hypothetical protein